jgi:hypothetical protein
MKNRIALLVSGGCVCKKTFSSVGTYVGITRNKTEPTYECLAKFRQDQ